MKIIHYRDNCIGCNSCVEYAPQYWKISEEDGKSILIGSTMKKGLFILETDESALEQNEKAAECCPMSIIKISK